MNINTAQNMLDYALSLSTTRKTNVLINREALVTILGELRRLQLTNPITDTEQKG